MNRKKNCIKHNNSTNNRKRNGLYSYYYRKVRMGIKKETSQCSVRTDDLKLQKRMQEAEEVPFAISIYRPSFAAGLMETSCQDAI